MIDVMEGEGLIIGVIIGGLTILFYLFFGYKWYRFVCMAYHNKPIRRMLSILIGIPLSPIVIPAFGIAWILDIEGYRSFYSDYEPHEETLERLIADDEEYGGFD